MVFSVALVAEETAAAETVVAEFDSRDATANIRDAIDQAGPGGTVVIPAADSPWLVSDQYGGSAKTAILLNRPNQIFRIESGARIEAKPGAFRGYLSTLMRIAADGVTVEGAGPENSGLAMNKDDYTAAPYELSQFRHAIDVGGFRGITISGITIDTPGGDGINLGGYFSDNQVIEDLAIRNVSIWRAHRNGISVSSVRDSVIENVSIWETSGVDPECAIDVELDHTYQRVQNVTVRDSVFVASKRRNMMLELYNYHNNSLDQGVPTSSVSIAFENCEFSQSEGGGIYIGGPDGQNFDLPKNVDDWCWVNFSNCSIIDSGGPGIEFSHAYADTGMNTWFDNVLVERSGRIKPDASPIEFLYGKPEYQLGDIGFYGSGVVIDDRSVPIVSAPGWVQFFGFKNIAAWLRVENASGAAEVDLGDNLENVDVVLY